MRSTDDESSAFVAAAKLGCMDMVKMLLDLGVPVNCPDAKGWTALHAAAEGGHLEVVKALLQHEASCSFDLMEIA